MTPSPGSASYFAQLSRDLMSHRDQASVVAAVERAAVQVVATCRSAEVVLGEASSVASEAGDEQLVVPLDTPDRVVGRLVLHSEQGQVFDDEDVEVARVYAAHATNALLSVRTVEELRTAVEARHSIGVAQGILMQSHEVGLDDAHEVLRRHAELQGVGVAAVAAHVVQHGVLPGETDGVH